jgi:hypothetical protein
VHLAILADEPALGVEHGRRVVIKAGRAFLEQACHERDAQILRERRERLRARPRNRLGERELRRILALAEIARAKQLRQHDERRALLRGVADALDRAREVVARVGAHRHLDEPDLERARPLSGHRGGSRSMRASKYVVCGKHAMY